MAEVLEYLTACNYVETMSHLVGFWQTVSRLCISLWMRPSNGHAAPRFVVSTPPSSAIELSTLAETPLSDLEEEDWDEVTTRDSDEAHLGAPTPQSWGG